MASLEQPREHLAPQLDGRVVRDFQKGDDALALAVGASDRSPQSTDVCPVVAQTAGPLRKQRAIADALEDMAEIVSDGGQVA
jgi:hypothetical protein